MLNYITKQLKAAYLNVNELELKVLDATNEEPWGPTGTEMKEIARLAEDRANYAQIMNVLHQRVADDLQRSVHILERLRDMFEYKDELGKDHGINVRQRAKDLVALVNSPQRLAEERTKAAKTSGKYGGVSAQDMQGSGGASSGRGGYGSGPGYSSGGGNGGGSGYGDVNSPSTENARHGLPAKPSSSSRGGHGTALNGGGGGGGGSGYASAGGGGGAGAGGDLADDPFEATRRRIEKLKADGALAESPAHSSGGGTFEPFPAEVKKGPKKLSEVKVNPQMFQTFGTLAAQKGAPSSAPNLLGVSKPASAAPQPAFASTHGLDLLGESVGPAAAPPAPPPAASTGDLFGDFMVGGGSAGQAVPSSSAAAHTGYSDPFASAPARAVSAATSSDPFAALAAAPATLPGLQPGAHTPPPAASYDPFAALSAPAPGSRPALVPLSNGTPAPSNDPFATLAAPPKSTLAAGASQPHGSSDPFAALSSSVMSSAAYPPATGDSFGMFVGPGGAAPQQQNQPLSGLFAAPAPPPSYGAPSAQRPLGSATVAPAGGATAGALGAQAGGGGKPKSADPFAGLGF